jgi:hypothetical protein
MFCAYLILKNKHTVPTCTNRSSECMQPAQTTRLRREKQWKVPSCLLPPYFRDSVTSARWYLRFARFTSYAKSRLWTSIWHFYRTWACRSAMVSTAMFRHTERLGINVRTLNRFADRPSTISDVFPVTQLPPFFWDSWRSSTTQDTLISCCKDRAFWNEIL